MNPIKTTLILAFTCKMGGKSFEIAAYMPS